MRSQFFIRSLRGLEHFVLVIQIKILERKEENIVLGNSKKEKEEINTLFSKKKQ